MKLKTTTMILALAAAPIAAAPAGASWFDDIGSYWDSRSILSKGDTLSTITASLSANAENKGGTVTSTNNTTEKSSNNSNSVVTSTSVSEPSNLLMLGLGIAGLVAGRYAAKRKRKKT